MSHIANHCPCMVECCDFLFSRLVDASKPFRTYLLLKAQKQFVNFSLSGHMVSICKERFPRGSHSYP